MEREELIGVIKKGISGGLWDVINRVAGIIFIVFLVKYCAGDFDEDTTDGATRSGMTLHVDALTGCHYLGGQRGGLVPRRDSVGVHICVGYSDDSAVVK